MGADIVIPGISTSVANPGLGPLAKARYGGVDRASHPPTLQEQCDGMQQKLEGMLKRMANASPPSEHLRPEPSRMRQLMSKVPLFRPKRMTEVLSFEKLDEVRTQIAGNVRSNITELTHWRDATAYIAGNWPGQRLANNMVRAANQARTVPATPLTDVHELADVSALSDLMAKARLQTAAAGSAREAADQTGEMLGRLQRALGTQPGFDPGQPPGGDVVAQHVMQARDAAAQARSQGNLNADQEKGWETVMELAGGWEQLNAASNAANRIKTHVDKELLVAERALVATMTEFPPGFSRTDAVGHEALAQSTQKLAARFGDQRPVQSSLAQSALIQITSDALRQTVGDDPARAARALDALMDRDPADWITRPGTLPQDPQTRQDVEQLFRTMSAVPRGIEVLAIAADHAAGNGASARTVDSVFRDMVDVRAYWSADRAALDPACPEIDKPWLDAAKNASSALLQGTPRETVAQQNPLGLGARGAIRNGFVSRAPGSAFDQCNSVMLRMVDEWVPNGTGRTGKTPFNKRTLELMDIVSRSLGINSAGVEADRATQAAVAEMHSEVDRKLDDARGAAAGAQPTPAEIGELIADSAMLTMLSGKGSFVSDGKLGPRVLAKKPDSERGTTSTTPAPTGGGITAVLQNHVKVTTKLDASDRARITARVNELMQGFPNAQRREIGRAVGNRIADLTSGLASRNDGDMSGLAMLGRVAPQHLTQSAGSHMIRADNQRQAVREASIGSLKELRDFLAPLLVDNPADQRGDHANKLGLRDRITLQGGRQFGASAGVVALATSKLGFAPILGLSRKSDAVFEVHHPMQGMQFAMSAKIEWRGEAGLAVGPGFEAGHLGRAGVQVSGRGTGARSSVAGMVLRIRRRAGDAAGMRADMVKLLDDLDQWNNTRTPAGGPGAQQNALDNSPLMHLLAHNDKLIVADFEQQGHNVGAEVKVDASIRAALPHGEGVSPYAQFGPNAFAAATVDKSGHRYTEGAPTEQHGTTTSFIERASIVRKAAKGGAGLSARVGADGHSGSVTPGFRSAFPLQGEREFAQDYERVHMTALTLDGVIDADHDRYYDRPEELFSDLETHRERWILRGMETMPSDLSVEQKRALSTELLDKFVADARLLQQESAFGIYNIHYTMRPQAAPQFEMLAAREALASLRNDEAGLAKIRTERESLLRDSSTWRQSTLNLLPNSRQARTRGLKIGLEGGVTYGVNGQRQLTEFPPRFTPALSTW